MKGDPDLPFTCPKLKNEHGLGHKSCIRYIISALADDRYLSACTCSAQIMLANPKHKTLCIHEVVYVLMAFVLVCWLIIFSVYSQAETKSPKWSPGTHRAC